VTIVGNDPTLKVGSGNLHWTRWTDGDLGHPDVPVLNDLGDFVSSDIFGTPGMNMGEFRDSRPVVVHGEVRG
jgi:hypothetical protein